MLGTNGEDFYDDNIPLGVDLDEIYTEEEEQVYDDGIN